MKALRLIIISFVIVFCVCQDCVSEVTNGSEIFKTSKDVCQPNRISITKCEEYNKNLLKPKGIIPPPGIVGGNYTKIAEFPHMALIGWQNQENRTDWKCGGTLISENFVLTAAHCTSDQGDSPTLVRLGEHDLKSTDDDMNLDQFEIKRIIAHPDYSFLRSYNDIALIELNGKVKFRKAVHPACLWQKFEIDHPIATATGWGKLEYGGEQSSILQKVDLSLFTNEECSKSYHKTRRLRQGIIDTQVCYGAIEGGKDTCQGDSGGPIQIINDSFNEYVYDIIGITSFGSYCGSTLPGVYTRIFSYLDWIESEVWSQTVLKI